MKRKQKSLKVGKLILKHKETYYYNHPLNGRIVYKTWLRKLSNGDYVIVYRETGEGFRADFVEHTKEGTYNVIGRGTGKSAIEAVKSLKQSVLDYSAVVNKAACYLDAALMK